MAKKNSVQTEPQVVIIDKSIKDHIDESYILFGGYVNQKRHMPHMKDGLKPSYRKMIYTGLTFPDKLVKVATLSGECGGKYSPHSPDSLNEVVSELVNAEIFSGQGSHGSKSIYKDWNIAAAAPRYIEAKVNPLWREVIEPVLPLVPKVTSDLGYSEPTYIPSPIPLSLLFGSLGLGIGIRSNIPTFSFKSIIQAHLNNDPNLLKPNGDIIINKKRSELQELWTTGKGRVSYMFLIDEDATSSNGVTKGYMMYGDPRFFQTKLTEALEGNKEKDIQGWIDKGLVIMRDESSRKVGKRIFFTVKPKQKQVTMEMLRKELEVMRYSQESFKLAISDGECTTVTPLRDWIAACYNNYLDLVDKYKVRKLANLELKVEVIKHAESFAKHTLANPKHKLEDISKSLGIDIEIVKEISKKPLGVLMKLDSMKELDKIAQEKLEIAKLEATDFYKSLMK